MIRALKIRQNICFATTDGQVWRSQNIVYSLAYFLLWKNIVRHLSLMQKLLSTYLDFFLAICFSDPSLKTAVSQPSSKR